MSHYREHVKDPRDTADTYVLLDGGEVREPLPTCLICGGPWPDECEHEAAPESYRVRPVTPRRLR